MPSPFPGMDPYLESQGYWQDFHSSFLTYCRKALNAVLPVHYAALIEERISLVDLSGDSPEVYRPDVSITRGERGAMFPQSRGATATLTPVSIPLSLEAIEELQQRWIEIRKLPDRSLVTLIELLSPTNKLGSGRIEYVEKRNQWLRQPVHLVEIDLLLGGHRVPLRRPLPPGDYYTFIARSDRRPNCDVYAWSIRRPLPTIPIPLLDPDPDVTLDLAALFSEAYTDAPYSRLIDYKTPMDLPLTDEDHEWVKDLLHQDASESGSKIAE
jgi:hypothetical protein